MFPEGTILQTQQICQNKSNCSFSVVHKRNTSVRHKTFCSSSPLSPTILFSPSQYNSASGPKATSQKQPDVFSSRTSPAFYTSSSSNTSLSDYSLNHCSDDLFLISESFTKGAEAPSTLVYLCILRFVYASLLRIMFTF
eukprot:TRINITY_DN9936_c0_g1_i1.p1 TRINITY_DN9936_c0_g1~~TRINITY_DN9936_c0_g1_i1.p1  ORF type:complete len:139 (+),score=4.87 TRINITY_DN9936_c0_g1_i1:107-523(+)